MENKITFKYGFINQILIIFSTGILFLTIIGGFIGDSAKQSSTMFSLGSEGLSFSVILQFLAVAIMIAALKEFIYSEKFLKNMMALWRTVIFLFSIIVIIIGFIIAFGWFPVESAEGWIGFFVSFGVCFIISTLSMVIRTRLESRKYEESFEKYKREHQEGDGEEDGIR
ncbi:hypothetical protein [[Clostridium] fimetarium]|uniref:Uncharacterized protein n=1 Tax=[Clostridium] fimetarium TaxID=99656 RepID=A0A1I0NU72_9FIRM|nr:hypothetical protein [[Clostridium] fimetarium]SEW04480.1 hypothetical protein SAMN05421659_103339 [[Clostridium] fimetarium]